MQMMEAMREQDAALERRLARMKTASGSDARLDAMAAVVEALAEQHLAHHAMMRDMPTCRGVMPMGQEMMESARAFPRARPTPPEAAWRAWIRTRGPSRSTTRTSRG